MRSSKISLLCRAIDPTFQDNREREEFGSSTLAPPKLRQTRRWILVTRSAGASLLTIQMERKSLQDHHNWQCTKGHSGTRNPQLSSKAEGETDRCEAICHKLHDDAVGSEHVQKQSSNPWSSCQLMCTFWPAFVPQGREELTGILYSSFTPLFPKTTTNKSLLRL